MVHISGADQVTRRLRQTDAPGPQKAYQIHLEKRLIDMCGMQAVVTKPKVSPVLRQTTDFRAMRRLALKSGLEEGNYDDYVVSYGYFVGEALVGCAGLKLKDGIFTVECLAVSERFRGMGMGRSLVEAIEREAGTRGAKEIWALARAPEFFMHIGFDRANTENPSGPSLKSCLTCQQYGRTCSPAIVRKTIWI
jgi:N-acetylglutamate synthase-like GNAT family acetyltransferase